VQYVSKRRLYRADDAADDDVSGTTLAAGNNA
jgi:hypothetical protein